MAKTPPHRGSERFQQEETNAWTEGYLNAKEIHFGMKEGIGDEVRSLRTSEESYFLCMYVCAPVCFIWNGAVLCTHRTSTKWIRRILSYPALTMTNQETVTGKFTYSDVICICELSYYTVRWLSWMIFKMSSRKDVGTYTLAQIKITVKLSKQEPFPFPPSPDFKLT